MRKCLQLLVIVPIAFLSGLLPINAQEDQEHPVITPENAGQVSRLAVLGHGVFSGLTWSPDGKTLAVASTAGVWLYNTADYEAAPRLLEVHASPQVVAYSPDGTLLATGGNLNASVRSTGGTSAIVQLWRVEDFLDTPFIHIDPVRELDCNLWDTWAGVTGLAFSPDGATLACVAEGVTVWNVATGENLAAFPPDSDPRFNTSAAFNPDGMTLATIGISVSNQEETDIARTVYIWDSQSYELLDSWKLDFSLNSLAYSPDGTLLAVDTDGSNIHVWETATGQEQDIWDDYYVRFITFSPNGSELALASETINRWNMATSERLPALERPSSDEYRACFGEGRGQDWLPCPYIAGPLGMAYSPDGTQLAAGDSMGQVYIWDAVTGEYLTALKGYSIGGMECGGAFCDIVTVTTIAVSPDGKTVAAGTGGYMTEGGWVELWDVETRALRGYLQGSGSMFGLAYSPDGTKLATASANSGLQLWDVESEEVRYMLDTSGDGEYGVAFSPDGNLLAAGNWDGAVHMWNTVTGETLAVLRGHTDSVSGVAFSPDGSLLASGSIDTTIRLWDVTDGKTLAVLEGEAGSVHVWAFSPDGRLLVSRINEDGGALQLWNIHEEDDVFILTDLTTLGIDAQSVRGLAFSPDGTILAIGLSDRTVRLWNTVTQESLAVLEERTAVSELTFSQDGTLLVSMGGGTIRLWGIPSP
jgi:WD40 repeat protein